MAAKKTIQVNESSIVDLKAELFRKELVFRKESETTSRVKSQGSKKPPVWAKQKKEQPTGKHVPPKDPEESSEQEKALQKSRKMLEAKAALYEKMEKGDVQDDGDDESGEGSRFLVDFHKKVYTKEQQVKSDEDDLCTGPIPPVDSPAEEWVEYVDSLGRSRKCLRKDLPDLQKRDRELNPRRSTSPPTLLSDDMRREMMRQKWEKQEQEAMERPVGPVHYQNIQYDEVRAHGVGYYQFSTDETERSKQMETLRKLRDETLDQRSRTEKIKEKRKAALEARLAKVRARKRLKTGDSDENKVGPEESEREVSDAGDDTTSSVNHAKEDVERLNGEEQRDRKTTGKKNEIPEWARHRIEQTDRRRPLHPREEERDPDFAPPSFYYQKNTPRATRQRCEQASDRQQAPPTPPPPVTQRTEHENTNLPDSPYTDQIRMHYPPYPPPPLLPFPPYSTPPGTNSNASTNIPPNLPPPPQEAYHPYHPPHGFAITPPGTSFNQPTMNVSPNLPPPPQEAFHPYHPPHGFAITPPGTSFNQPTMNVPPNLPPPPREAYNYYHPPIAGNMFLYPPPAMPSKLQSGSQWQQNGSSNQEASTTSQAYGYTNELSEPANPQTRGDMRPLIEKDPGVTLSGNRKTIPSADKVAEFVESFRH